MHLVNPHVRELIVGCDTLHLPHNTATELVRYLTTKRWMAFVGQDDLMSPSLMLDKLWHWMLLNTRIAASVYDFIGGVVEHSTTTMNDPDEVKVKRQLFSMTTMAQFGWLPTLDLWQVQGTLMSSVRKESVMVDGIPDATIVYVCDFSTEEDVAYMLKEFGYDFAKCVLKRALPIAHTPASSTLVTISFFTLLDKKPRWILTVPNTITVQELKSMTEYSCISCNFIYRATNLQDTLPLSRYGIQPGDNVALLVVMNTHGC